MARTFGIQRCQLPLQNTQPCQEPLQNQLELRLGWGAIKTDIHTQTFEKKNDQLHHVGVGEIRWRTATHLKNKNTTTTYSTDLSASFRNRVRSM